MYTCYLTTFKKYLKIKINRGENMWTQGKESLCNSHNTIRYWANDAKKKLKKAIKNDDYSEVAEIINILNDIIDESRIAKKKGSRLEARLKRYRFSIEKLGFKRVNK